MIFAVMATITLCACAHAMVFPTIKQSYLKKRSVKDLRADARASNIAVRADNDMAAAAGVASAAGAAGLQVPIHKTTMTIRKEDAQ